MDEQQRDGAIHRSSLVHVVHIQLTKSLHLNRTREHGNFVQLALMSAPVISIFPPFSQPFDARERNTVIPACAINFVWETGVVKFTLEPGKCLWDGDLEGPGLVVRHSR